MYWYTSNPADMVAAGLLGGCNLDCDAFYQLHAQVYVEVAIAMLLAHIDRVLTRVFTYR